MSGETSPVSPIIIDEPFGHSKDETKIERFLMATERYGPVSLHRERALKFDLSAGMSYAPMLYVARPFSVEKERPSADWLVEQFADFVRGEFPASPGQATGVPPEPIIEEEEYLSDGFLGRFLEASEDAAPFVSKDGVDNDLQMAHVIYQLLCDPRVGSKKNGFYNPEEPFIRRILPVIEKKSRLLFILPGFPFKDQNRFRVPFDAFEPDLADISFLIRLHRLTQALYQVHPFGADVLVLTDGFLYADLFNVHIGDVSRYAQHLTTYRNILNLQGTVSFYPLDSLISRSGDNGAFFWHTVDYVEQMLSKICASHSTSRDILRTLELGMRRNMQTRHLLSDFSYAEAWEVVWGSPETLGSTLRTLRVELDERVASAALRYASINLVIRWIRLIDLFFPGAIRGTVHAKSGQFALAGSGGAYAWNGVAWSKAVLPVTIDDVEVKPYSVLGENRSNRLLRFRSGLPAFFSKGGEVL